MTEIKADSRYFEPFKSLVNIANYVMYYDFVYNDDKQTWNVPYKFLSYKNTFDEVGLADKIYTKITDFFNTNLYSVSEQILLIENLIPNITGWGNKEKEQLNRYKKYYSKESNYSKELEKTVTILYNAERILKGKIKLYYQTIIDRTVSIKRESTQPTQETPEKFEELFYNVDLIEPSIDILKEIEPPLIDTDSNYIGKLKGTVCVWIDELQRQGIVKRYSDRKIFASLIPQKINSFSIDESMFGKPQKKAEEKYRIDIKTKVSSIKLSQDSRKGKLGK